jgi:hypothetical protein
MKLALAVLIAFTTVAACASPETARSRGSGPGADVGNRGKFVEMHEGSQPFWKTPRIIGTQHAPVDSASQADRLSRQ